MASTIFILFFTTLIILGCRILPSHLRTSIEPHQIAMALALPILGSLSGHFLIFAVFALLFMIYAPTVSYRGFTLLRLDAAELRARMLLLCLPLMPQLTYTLAFGGLTVVQLTYPHLLCLGLLVSMLIGGQRILEPRLAMWDLLFLLMLLSQIIMDVRGYDLTESMRSVLHVLLNLALPYLVFSRITIRAKSPNDLVLSMIIGGCIIALIAAYESSSVWLLYDNFPYMLNADPDLISGYTKMRDGLLRARASFPESTGLSLYFGVLITMLIAVQKQLASKMTFLVTLGVLVIGAFFTFARIGYLAIAVGMVANMLQRRNWGSLIALSVAIPILGLILFVAAENSHTLQASLGMGEEASGTTDYRSDLLNDGLAFFRENWLLGSSLENLLLHLEHLRQGEGIIDLVNQPLTILMRGGAFGFLMYYLFMICVLIAAFIRGPYIDKEARSTVTACFGAIFAVTIGLLTTSYGRNEMTFIVLLAMCSGALSRSKKPATQNIGSLTNSTQPISYARHT